MTLLCYSAGTRSCADANFLFHHATLFLPHKQRLNLRPGHQQRRSSWTVQAANRLGDLEDLEVEVPDLDCSLRWYQELDQDVEFSDDGVPLTFGNDEDALFTWSRGSVITDRSACGRLRISGRDRMKFLHGQSTADIQGLTDGQSADTCFITAQGRIVDLVRVLVQPSSVILITSPGTGGALLERLQRFVLYGDEVEVVDISARTALFTLAGPAAAEVLVGAGAHSARCLGAGRHSLLQCGGGPVIVAAGGALGPSDFTLLADESICGGLWRTLTSQGAVAMGAYAWGQAAVLSGRPSLGRELTDQYNPLEAGLFAAVSLSKGCYMGQETLAKAATKGVAKQLWGVQMAVPAERGATVTAEGRKLGTLTCAAVSAGSATWLAMAYLLCREKGKQLVMKGRVVEVAGCGAATVVDLPFMSREFARGAAPLTSKQPEPSTTTPKVAERLQHTLRETLDGRCRDCVLGRSNDDDAAEGRNKRMQEMQAKLSAWQTEQNK